MAGSDSTPAIEFPITIIIDEEFELTTHRSAIEYSLVPSFPLGIGGAALLSRCFQGEVGRADLSNPHINKQKNICTIEDFIPLAERHRARA
jgi:hypothetical protein